MLPPEVNSTRMYSGPGAGSLWAAAAAWDQVSAELQSAAETYRSVIASLTGWQWLGPSSVRMGAAVTPYVEWLTTTAAQARQTATQITAAATGFEQAFAMTVPPPAIMANRAQVLSLMVSKSALPPRWPRSRTWRWRPGRDARRGYHRANVGAARLEGARGHHRQGVRCHPNDHTARRRRPRRWSAWTARDASLGGRTGWRGAPIRRTADRDDTSTLGRVTSVRDGGAP